MWTLIILITKEGYKNFNFYSKVVYFALNTPGEVGVPEKRTIPQDFWFLFANFANFARHLFHLK